MLEKALGKSKKNLILIQHLMTRNSSFFNLIFRTLRVFGFLLFSTAFYQVLAQSDQKQTAESALEKVLDLQKLRAMEKVYRENVFALHMRYLYRHKYFDDAAKYPFHTESTKYDLNNAWWMAEFATLSNTEPKFVEVELNKAGFESRFFRGDETDAECFVAWNEKAVIVSFRGTEAFGFTDWMTDAKFNLVTWPYGGRVHRGFRTTFYELWITLGVRNFLKSLVVGHSGQKKSVWFTGHSLGSALATLAVDAYGDDCQLYTYGSPRVGDEAFQAGFHRKAHRFVNDLDLVTSLPPTQIRLIYPYYHVGSLLHFDIDGNLRKKGEISSVDVLDLAGFWDKIKKAALVRIFLDHVPTFYIDKIKKRLEVAQEKN